jgi:hypothetical protein
MHRVKNNHAFGNFGGVIAKFAAACVAAPNFERGRHDLNYR